MANIERIYSDIEPGTTDYYIETLLGEPHKIVSNTDWPNRIGQLHGYEDGVGRELVFGQVGPAGLRISPNAEIFWLLWRVPHPARWISVAVLGNVFRQGDKIQPVVTKRWGTPYPIQSDD